MVEGVETRAADVGESGGRLLRGIDRGAGVFPAQPLGTGPEKVRQSHTVGEMKEKRSRPFVLRSLQVHGAIACSEKKLEIAERIDGLHARRSLPSPACSQLDELRDYEPSKPGFSKAVSRLQTEPL